MEHSNSAAVMSAIRIVGSQRALARALSIAPTQVGQWRKPEEEGGRPIPPKKCVLIERITGGKVSRRDLRPDDWHDIWPELAQQAPAAINSEASAAGQEPVHG